MRLNKYVLLFTILFNWSTKSTSGFIAPKALSLRSDVSVNTNGNHISYETNQRMDELAEQCGDHNNPVVSIASQVEEIYQSIDEKNVVAFNVLLKAWGKVCLSLEKRKKMNYSLKDELSTKSVLSVSIHSARDAVEHLTKHLMEAEASDEKNPENNGVIPDETSYNTVIDAWAKSTLPDSSEAAERLLRKMINNPRLEPCSISYNSVLNCYARSRDPSSLEKMKNIWEHMQNLAANGNEKIKPCIRTVNIILQGYSRIIGRYDNDDDKLACAKEARSIFENVKAGAKNGGSGVCPEADTYSFIIEVYAGVGSKTAALKAEGLMEELKQIYRETQDSRLQPNARTYTSLIGAWSRTFDKTAAIRAERIVEEMESIYANRIANEEPLRPEELTTKPNSKTFKNVLYTIMYAQDDDKARKALKVLMKMREYGKTNPECAPTIGAYNQAIDACARSRTNQVDALKIAFAMLKTVELDNEIKANAKTYGIGIKVTECLLPRGFERNKLALAVFEKAKRKGLVNADIMRHARKALDSDKYHELMQSSEQPNTSINNIPRDWSRNIF